MVAQLSRGNQGSRQSWRKLSAFFTVSLSPLSRPFLPSSALVPPSRPLTALSSVPPLPPDPADIFFARSQCTYIQLDDTNMAYLCSEEMRAAAEERGEDVETLPMQYVKLINLALSGKPANMTVAVHLCR